MIIACPRCTTCYTVDAAAFRAPGRTVRCTTCDHTWFQAPAKPVSPTAPVTPAVAVAGGAVAEETFPPGDEQIATETARMIAAARMSAERFRDVMTRRRGMLREWAMLIAGIALVVAGGLALRDSVVRHLPAAAGIYRMAGLPVNIRGLDFRDVSYERQYENGIVVLAIKGQIVNIRDEAQEIPKLRFGVRDGLSQELYHWYMNVTRKPLPPGESLPFVARLASPPADAFSVEVRFATAHETGSPFGP